MGAWWEQEAAQEDEWAAAQDEEDKDPNDDSWGCISLVIKYALLLTLLICGQSVVVSASLTNSISGASITVRKAGNAQVVIEGEAISASNTSGGVAATTTDSTAEALSLEKISTWTAGLAVVEGVAAGASERADIAQGTSVDQNVSDCAGGTSLLVVDWRAEGGASGDEG